MPEKGVCRLLPLLFVCYVIAYVDRVNVGFAKLNMQKDLAPLGFSESAFGFGMGVFFIGYLVLEIPGTLIVERWSAEVDQPDHDFLGHRGGDDGVRALPSAWGHRVGRADRAGAAALLEPLAKYDLGWLTQKTGTVVTWLRDPGSPFVLQFFSVRFLLGLAEAGFYPGVIVYLTHWFPKRNQTKAMSWFFIGTPVAAIVGPPISEQIMAIGVDGNPMVWGMVGWQWVFIIWGIPAVILGFLVLAILADRPRDAHWLTNEERAAIETTLDPKSTTRSRVRGT